MKVKFLICIIVVVLLSHLPGKTVAQGDTQGTLSKNAPPLIASPVPQEFAYRIGAGDELSLSVWKDLSLSRNVIVLSDGTISLPLIGQINAANKSVFELEEEIRERIKRYLPNPVFDIAVMQPKSMMIYVVGNVNSPGQFSIQTDINVLQAISMAGGLGDYAEEDEIKIYREEGGHKKFHLFEYDEVIKGKKMEQNIKLQRGDVVVVP